MLKSTLLATAALFLAGCQSAPRPPIALAGPVDLPRFMGDWYVIANIPTFLEKGAHNAVESYRLEPDGSIATTFTFRAGAFDGPEKRYTPRGFVREGQGNAVWGMQFLWPIQADFRIVYLTPDYGQTVIGREARDYVWIMARTPAIPEADYQSILAFLAGQGYDVTRIQRVPQRWEKSS
ncbi:MAG: outer membrane lipoprotein Blc [bacterium]|nr:MAG: outer membrane lipoprotein Blc [bacterium]KAF0149607.1 MAG: outer membrane lipoprotein Blc [bacterium]KAF0169273.1 MAG: outer membrane lipoprotein Blc [bacterium]TXT20644.1 MAG: outer membrane lipoprotein Blc [bacterium]